jgi:hypothetical protein
MQQFLMGAIAMGSFVIALFFARFWRTSGDRLFGFFALSFLLLGVTRIGLVLFNDAEEGATHWYWLRLVSFLLILGAIVDKNRRRSPS